LAVYVTVSMMYGHTKIKYKCVIFYVMHLIIHVYFTFNISLTINYACHFLDICIYYNLVIIS